jgi:hypothetical protein
MLRIILIFSILLLTSCASTHMKQYVGKDIREVVLDSGPPFNVMDMGEGVRAFQFMWGGGSFIVPAQTTTSGSLTSSGNAAWYSSTSLSTGGGVVNSEGCIISYLTKWDEQRKSWVVYEYRIPKSLVC